MKLFKRLLGFCLTLFLVITISAVSFITVNAAGYKVDISLGNNKFAEFNSGADALGTVSTDGRKLTINRAVTIDEIKNAITIKPDPSNNEEKYMFDGIRISGNDSKYTGTTVALDEDESYVVAYKICKIVPYTVEYRYKTASGVTMDKVYNEKTKSYVNAKPNDVLYGAVNEKITVPAQEIVGYQPDAYSKTYVLADTDTGNKIVFVYSAAQEKIEITEETYTKYIFGDPTYRYNYEYVDGGPYVTVKDVPGRSVVNNRRETGQNNVVEPQAADNSADENGATVNETSDTTTIGDSDTPLAGEKKDQTKIPEPETPKRIEPEKNELSLVAKVVLTITVITILVLIMITITTYIMRRRH